MSEQQEERIYRLFDLGETPELADLNPNVKISPDNVGQRITVPINEKTQQIPSHHWTKNGKRPAETCDLYKGRLGSVLVSVPANLTLGQVRPDLWYYDYNERLFYPDPYSVHEEQDVTPKVDATIQDGRLEKVREIVLMDEQILSVRSAIVDAIQRGTTTAHFLINHPYRSSHVRNGGLIVFRDKVEEERMVAAIINDVRLHKTIDEVLVRHDCGALGKATERDVRKEWSERMRTEKQAFDLHGLKSFKFKLFPKEIPITAPQK